MKSHELLTTDNPAERPKKSSLSKERPAGHVRKRERVTTSGVGVAAMTRQCLIVLGMHRSGTSALTRVMSLMGASLPSGLLPSAIDNERGFWEAADIMRLNDEIFAFHGLEWDDAAVLPPQWVKSAGAREFILKAQQILNDNFGDSPFFIIKDPRMCRLLPLWQAAFLEMKIDQRYALIVRNPLEVAESLRKRSDYADGKSLILWLLHVLDAERYTRGLKRTFVRYDNLLRDWRAVMATIERNLDITWPKDMTVQSGPIEHFLTSKLRHHAVQFEDIAENRAVNSWVRAVYSALHNVEGDVPEQVQRVFDDIFQQVLDANTLYGVLLSSYRHHAAYARDEEAKLRQMIADRDVQLANIYQENNGLKEESAQRGLQIDQLGREKSSLSNELSQKNEQLAILGNEKAELSSRFADKDGQLRELIEENSRLMTLVEQKDSRVQQLERDVPRLVTELADKEELLRLQTVEKARLENVATEKEEEREKLEADISRLVSELADKEEQLGLQVVEKERLENVATEKEEEREKLEADISRLVSELADKDGHLMNLAEEVSRITEVVLQKDERIRLLSAENGRLNGEVSRQEARVGSVIERAAQTEQHLTQEISHMQVVHALQRRTIADFEATEDRIHRSVGWKIMKPVRRVSRALSLMPSIGLIPLKIVYWTLSLQLKRKLRFLLHEIIIARSGLFDAAFYLERNHDVAEHRVVPLEHYAFYGASEGRDPNPLFQTAFYLEHNPDIADSGCNPLVHYIRHGAAEGRNPNPYFDSHYYLEHNPDVAQVGVNPLAHYLKFGAWEGRDPSPLFSTMSHLARHPHLVETRTNPLAHYLGGVAGGQHQHSHLRGNVATVPAGAVTPETVTNSPRGKAHDSVLPQMPPIESLTGTCIVTPDIVGPVKNGGIGTACYHFARVLAKLPGPVSILYTGDVSDPEKARWRKFYAEMNINFFAISDTPAQRRPVYCSYWFLDRSWRVYCFLKQAKFRTIHFQDWQGTGFWSIRSKRLGRAFETTTLTVMMHSCTKWINQGMEEFGTNPLVNAQLVWSETYCLENCDMVLSPSRHMFQWAAENGITLPERAVLTPYCFDGSNAKGDDPRAVVDHDHLVFFGRLETRKGLHVLGDALRLLKEQGATLPKQVSLLGKHALVEGRPSEKYLEQLQQDLPSVKFRVINGLNNVEAIDYVLHHRGLAVMPSLLDNAPLTVIECIVHKIPFLASNAGGIGELANGQVLFDPSPADMCRVLKDRHSMDHVKQKHPYEAHRSAEIWSTLHRELAQTNGSSESAKRTALQTRRPEKVSVCIPHYNHGQFLQVLVEAFAMQTYPDFEVIVVDDGSKKPSFDEFNRVAQKYAKDHRFQFLTKENQGPGMTRNYAAVRAKGEYLVFFDADNLPKTSSFLHDLVIAIKHSAADCVTCAFDAVDACVLHPSEKDIRHGYRPYGSCTEAAFFINVLGDATMIIRHDVFQTVEGFPTERRAWEDHEFLLKVCLKGFKLLTIPEALYYYRFSADGRNVQANSYLNYRSLMTQLAHATPETLRKIVTEVTVPLLAAQKT